MVIGRQNLIRHFEALNALELLVKLTDDTTLLSENMIIDFLLCQLKPILACDRDPSQLLKVLLLQLLVLDVLQTFPEYFLLLKNFVLRLSLLEPCCGLGWLLGRVLLR